MRPATSGGIAGTFAATLFMLVALGASSPANAQSQSAGGPSALGQALATHPGTFQSAAIQSGQPAVPAAAQQSVAGLWLDHGGKAAIEVKTCGGEVCGKIVWLKDPLDPRGKPWTDMLNPDKAKRKQPVCGLQIIGGLKGGREGVWQDGWIYDPEEGKNFNVELSLEDSNTLKVFGYAGVRLLSETMHWKRLPGEPPRCKA